ncbi:DUF2795 domain-containing protein [Geomesophilobacter sediminis]|uniref:DUF2795 domain-containing protein n=1 Tax=Geomesophilobacter sediminis TaxID=2798584 RepID=A0A8J7JEL0_9BACT|nr:DUF2795 domain-containing protein [Geomesophilobacter sediminis]MBJ6726113.1 DUF2795 domain-containing protein [Geomesophilobacter sediminis]
MATTAGRGTGHSPANVSRFLKGIDFPAKKDDLVKHAQQNKAEKSVIDEIQKMEQREFESMADVMKAYGKEPEHGKKQSTQARESRGSSQHQQHK